MALEHFDLHLRIDFDA